MTADLLAFLATTFLLGYAVGRSRSLFDRPAAPVPPMRPPGRLLGYVTVLRSAGGCTRQYGTGPGLLHEAERLAFGAMVHTPYEVLVCEVRAVRGVTR